MELMGECRYTLTMSSYDIDIDIDLIRLGGLIGPMLYVDL